MGYKVQTFEFKIGDSGVYQSDDTLGGAIISASGTLTPDYGETIINVASLVGLGVGTLTNAQPSSAMALSNTTVSPGMPWSVSASWDAMSVGYPLAAGTTVLTITAVVAD